MGRIANDEVVEDEVNEVSDYKKESLIVNVQCFPLYTYLLALNVTVIDYFSLDVEGSELNVLKTIPFDKIDIRVSSIVNNLCVFNNINLIIKNILIYTVICTF